jgi:hypothetical protein
MEETKNYHKKIKDSLNIKINKAKNTILNFKKYTFLTFLSQEELLNFSERITESKADIYDKALDAEYLKTNIGGGNHRMFDGGHDIVNAWKSIKYASEDDLFLKEFSSYFNSLWKDLNTNKGLPFFTWDKNVYDKTADWLTKNLLIANKNWVYDLFSFDQFEILSSTLSIATVIFSLKEDDTKRIAEVLGAAGIISIISANLLMGISVVFLVSYSYFVKKKEFIKKDFTNGIFISGVSMSIFSILEISLFLELLVVIAITKILKDNLNKDFDIKNTLAKTFNNFKINIRNRGLIRN